MDPAPPAIYTLSLHDALPIFFDAKGFERLKVFFGDDAADDDGDFVRGVFCFELVDDRSEEHTSELQSRGHLVCRLLLEKKKGGRYGEIVADMRERESAQLLRH